MREATAMRSLRTAKKSSPRLPQLEKARVQQRRPNADKNKFFKKSFKNKQSENLYNIYKYKVLLIAQKRELCTQPKD